MLFFRIKKVSLTILLILSTGFLQATDVEYPLIQSLAHFPFLNHQILPKNLRNISLELNYSNIFMFDKELTSINDMETMNLTAAFRYGLTSSITLELYLRLSLIYGGIMDGLIDMFHKVLGISPGGRDLYPQYTLNYRYKDHFFHSKVQLAMSAPILTILTPITTRKKLSLSARVGIKLPLFNKPGFNSGQTAFLAGLISTWQTENLTVEFSNHMALFPQPDWLSGMRIGHLIWHGEMSVKYKKIRAGFIFRTSPFKTEDLTNNAYQIYAGIKIKSNMEFLFIEEIPPLDTTPDFTFCFRIFFN